MSNNVRVLAEDEILSHNQDNERNFLINKAPTKVSRRYVEELEDEIRSLKIKEARSDNEIEELKAQCLGLYRKMYSKNIESEPLMRVTT